MNNAIKVAAIVLLMTVLSLNFVAFVLIGPYAWDDGAITLAFSRTIAEEGRFSLTGPSEIVEGSSSLLLTFLLALMHKLFGFNFEQFITASQALAYASYLATLWLINSALRNSLADPIDRYTVLTVIALFPAFTAEIMNGMEMMLMGLLLLLFFQTFLKQSKWAYFFLATLILVRFEAIFYLVFSFSLYWIFVAEERRTANKYILATIAIFGCVSLFRFAYFEDLVPNTIWAKMQPPYSLDGSLLVKLASKLEGLVEYLAVAAVLIIASLISLFLPSKYGKIHHLGIFIVISFMAFSLITGKNWGYSGRMTLASIPLLIMLCSMAFSGDEFKDKPIKIEWGSRQWVLQGQRSVFLFLFFICTTTLALNSGLMIQNIKAITDGVIYSDQSPDGQRNPTNSQRNNQSEFGDWYGVTPENYRITGTAIDEIRNVLGLSSITFMTPDVGGLALCCPRIKVLDSALLTNRQLARSGYAFFAKYLAEQSPDIIETHRDWSQVSRIYETRFFQENYLPIVYKNNLLWARGDVEKRLRDTASLHHKYVDPASDLENVRYAGWDIDKKYLVDGNFKVLFFY